MSDTLPMLRQAMDRATEGGSSPSRPDGDARRVPQWAPVQAGPAHPASRRPHLFHALERVLQGVGLSRGELEAAITDPQTLTGLENDAWEQLGYWVDEADVRARDENYTVFHLDWLKDLHSKLAP
jgi:hypothetical protein